MPHPKRGRLDTLLRRYSTTGVVGVLKTYCNRERATSDLCSLLEEVRSSKPRLRLPKSKIGKSTRKLAPAVTAEIVELYLNGMSTHDIAERLNIHRVTVSNYLELAAVVKRPKGLTREQTDEAAAVYELAIHSPPLDGVSASAP